MHLKKGGSTNIILVCNISKLPKFSENSVLIIENFGNIERMEVSFDIVQNSFDTAILDLLLLLSILVSKAETVDAIKKETNLSYHFGLKL